MSLTLPPDAASGSPSDVLRSARGVTGAYYRLAAAEASLARRALLDATVRGGIAFGLAVVAALMLAAAGVAGLVALGLAWPWAALLVAALAAIGAALSLSSASRCLDDTRFEATRRQLDRLFETREAP